MRTLKSKQKNIWQTHKRDTYLSSFTGASGIIVYELEATNITIAIIWDAPYDFNIYSNEMSIAIIDKQAPQTNAQLLQLYKNITNNELVNDRRCMQKYYSSINACQVSSTLIKVSGSMGKEHHPIVQVKVLPNIKTDTGTISFDGCGKDNSLIAQETVWNGKETKPHQFPWMAYIGISNNEDFTEFRSCGGSLISPKYVLTAAHCLKNETDPATIDNTVVILGHHNISKELKQCEWNTILNIFIYPIYDGDDGFKTSLDIAILELEEIVDFNDNTKNAICLPSENGIENVHQHESGFIAGWGITNKKMGKLEKSELSLDKLLSAIVKIRQNEFCNDKYGFIDR